MRGPTLKTSKLTKSFGDSTVVKEVSLAIQPGEILGLLGANGAGKSTTMQLLLGLIKPTSGGIEVFGMDLKTSRLAILRQMNFSSSYANLPSNLTVSQNLNVFAGLYGVPRPKEKIKELLELLEIPHLSKRITGQLSSGESTRLNLCKALINDPKLLLLDEPTASLDPDIADKVRSLVKKLRSERSLSILYTSHNMLDIETICDRIIFLHKGRIMVEGTRGEIKQHFQDRSLEDVFIHIARDGEIVDRKTQSSA